MSKGLERHQQRIDDLNALGRALARRAKSHCELCEQGGISLQVWEVTPLPETVDIERCLLLCDPCLQGLTGKMIRDPSRWNFLTTAVWSDLPPVQVCAVRLLRRLCEERDWARETLEDIYLDPEIEAWADRDK